MLSRPFEIGIVLLAIVVLTFSCKEEKQQSKVTTVDIKFKKEGELSLLKATNDSLIKRLNIEIADDDYQTETGLMYRKSLEDNQGMLFVFPDSQYRSFYMRNTEFPLDIIYIDQDKTIVSIQKNAQPLSEQSLPSEGPAKFVLEVNAGLSDLWHLEKGDRMEFSKY